MREILFRGKGKYDGLWKYGSLERFMPNRLDLANCFIISETAAPIATSVIPETVGQFTGLTDRNGNKIFEGDIVRHYNDSTKPRDFEIYQIGWCARKARFSAFCPRNEESYEIWQDCDYEIIGNIHDNPKLIGGDSNAD